MGFALVGSLYAMVGQTAVMVRMRSAHSTSTRRVVPSAQSRPSNVIRVASVYPGLVSVTGKDNVHMEKMSRTAMPR